MSLNQFYPRFFVFTALAAIGLSGPLSAQLTSGDYTYLVEDEAVIIIGYTCGVADLVIPETIEGLPVVSIRNSAFRNCDTIETVTFPGTLREIGSYAFWNCSSLKALNFSEGLETIGYNAFDECRALEAVELPSTLKTIDRAAFEECSALTSFFVPAGVETIGGGIVGRCTALTELLVDPANANYVSSDNIIFSKDGTVLVQYFPPRDGHYTVPNTVTAIQEYAFNFCRIESLSIHEGITELPPSMVAGCAFLVSIQLPETLTTIGFNAIFNCNSLESITIPQNVESIDGYAFAYCRKLAVLTIPASVQSLGREVFNGCEKLSSITFEGGVPILDNAVNLFHDPAPVVYYYDDQPGWTETIAGASTQALRGAQPWRGLPVYVDGWMQSDWYGWFQGNDENWIYHLEHGWQSAIGESEDNIFVYDNLLGDWWYLSQSLYPYIYMFGSNVGWYLYSTGGTPGERWFYKISTQAWVQEPVLE